ncbi:hypothetical protein PIB30_080607 [Stylosanthes scabra]|uniref:Uncharacterized protein n=1 Tax=Stylosanthes scabra TaxID=79078 RepID=A0ABU6XT93_9FABA|nr:hypothetical protein [Stylosanthes scabra]
MEKQEIREAQNRMESQQTPLIEMLQRITSQPTQIQSSSPIPLPPQPLPNPKGGINVFHSKEAKGEKDEDENKEGSVSWWYNLLAQLVDSDDKEDEESEDESKEEDEDEGAEEDTILFNNKEIKEEVSVKCEDLGPCLVTCKIKGVEIRECLCDPGTCSSVMPYEGPLKKTKEIFTTTDASIVSVVGIAENILVRIGELNSSSSITMRYSPSLWEIPLRYFISHHLQNLEKKSLHQLHESKGKESLVRKAKMWKTPRGRSSDEKGMRNAPTQSKGEKKKISLNIEKKKKKKKKEPDEGSTQKKKALKCLSFDRLLGKLIVLKNVLHHNENIDTHLVKNNSKWK